MRSKPSLLSRIVVSAAAAGSIAAGIAVPIATMAAPAAPVPVAAIVYNG
jgi:hypothetical protein